jgi:hypothetical protein
MKFFGGDDFDGIFLIGFGVFSSINFTVIALSDNLQKSVIVDHFDHGKMLKVDRRLA